MPKIAIVQAGTVLYDKSATLAKVKKYVDEAAGNGAELVLFPEAFIGGYPKWNNFGITMGTRTPEGRKEFKRYFENAIEEHGEESKDLEALAGQKNIHIVIGVVEREAGTLYCSVFFYSPDGYLGKHRKLLPTALERCVWGQGDGSTMPVFDTKVGKLGSAICWENYMPLYRMSLYNKALEGRCFVVSACQFLKSSAYPSDHVLRKEHGDDTILIRGGSCAVDPLGAVLVEPDFTQETIRYAEFDLSDIALGKMDLDVVGHYSRPDVFQLTVNEKPMSTVTRN
ncbi:Protein CBR-NIT-1 [Caenorhabditis briggsae]|uniref:Protein CBR-NIT-1 n=1 Tax=Caenorhabditis briggsae TaxID=6238 RepID=A8WVF1_CAEBR|nr:Protein CBR-NIT-1 [Caenorhabditis briggsae]CAP24462.2 Protein CBR-NIT-1 [Caenorhabditis briggsae]